MSTQTPAQLWTGISTATIASHLARHGFRNQFMAGLGSYDPVRAAYESWRTDGSPKTQPLAAFRLGEGAL